MNTFDRFENRTVMQARLEMETALSVGGRLSLEPTGTDLPVVKTPDGKPFIPGSSIKGVVRFQAERILRSLNRQPDLWACNPFESQFKGHDELNQRCVPASCSQWRRNHNGARCEQCWECLTETSRKNQGEVELSRRVFEKSCTACRLFGSPWFASRLSFKDAILINWDELLIATQIRDGVAIDRDLGAARSRAKYDFEVVVPGACFEVEILAENLEDWEIGFLLAVLRLWQEGNLAIGGKTTRGPGWGVLRDLKLSRVTQPGLLDYLIQGKTEQVEAEQFSQAFLAKTHSSKGKENHA
jgi:CRISPR-associated protein Csm3